MKTHEFERKFDPQINELERQLSNKDDIIKKLVSEQGKTEVYFRRIQEAITPIEPLTNNYIPDYSNVKADSPLVYSPHLTDWHTGEVQDASEIEGFNEYNPDVQDRRIDKFTDIIIRKVTYDRLAYRIDRIEVIFTGDLISGDIHDELKITNAYPLPVQIVETAKKKSKMLAILAANFAEVVVHDLTADNHSRLTKKPQFKEEGRNSHNYVVAEMTKAYLINVKNVEYNIYPMHEVVINVHGMKYLISHGHEIRGWMGIPWYSVIRKLGKEAMARMQLIMNARDNELEKMKQLGFHKFKFGHFHTYFDNDQYSCGSSLSGTNALDHADGRFGFPGQTLTVIHPNHGELSSGNIRLV